MIRIKKSTNDDIQFTLMQISDNERVALSLVTATDVRFHAKQTGPSPNADDPVAPKTLDLACTIVNPVTGIVTVPLTAGNTDTEGEYQCYIEVKYPGSIVYNKYPFEMTIWDI